MKNTLKTLAMGFIMAILVGCQTAPMTAKSRLVTGGEITTTTITVTDGVTNMVQVIKSPSAGDLELKEYELKGRTQVGTEKEKSKGGRFLQWLWTPAYGGGYYGGGYVSPPPYGSRGGAYGGNVFYP